MGEMLGFGLGAGSGCSAVRNRIAPFSDSYVPIRVSNRTVTVVGWAEG